MKTEQSCSVAALMRASTVSTAGSALMLALFLSGCASSGAPAPVEQRASAAHRASVGGYRDSAPAPARQDPDGGIEVTGLGEDAAPSQSLPAWSAPMPSTAAESAADSTRGAPPPRPTPTRPANGDISAANPAVVALLNRANRESAAGREDASAASLERAIKIEPGNAWLWHRLAQTRLKQNKPGEAASIAARSNSLAGNNDALRARNWRLIAHVHDLRGESVAAQAARSKAERLERGTS